jgi:hypothetical protein
LGHARKPVVEKQPEIIFSPGAPLVLNDAPNGRSLSSEFLTDFAAHYHAEGKDIFRKIYRDFPTHYWAGLITLAKVLKIEIGKPHDFDRPSTKDEALDRLERTAGPHARKMLEKFLDQVAKAEAEYLDQTDSATSLNDAASRRR